MQARLVKRERSYMVGIAVSIPSDQQQHIKLSKTVMKRLVSLQRYLTLQGTEEIIAIRSSKQHIEGHFDWVIGYDVPRRFLVHRDFTLCEVPSGTYFVGTKGARVDSVYTSMKSHWIMAEMYDENKTLFERYTISGEDKRVEVFSRVKAKTNPLQNYA